MPYYKWRGVNLVAEWQNGTTFARSQPELDRDLFEQGIALLSCRPVTWYWLGGPVRLPQVISFFRELSVLVGTGVLLPEALVVVAEQATHRRMREVVHGIAIAVEGGEQFSVGLEQYRHVFSGIVVQLIQAGEGSGALSRSLEAVSMHLERTNDFYTRLRAALLMPVITFSFFVLIAIGIFVFVIPYFSELFGSMHQDLPAITSAFLYMSQLLTGWNIVWGAVVASVACVAVVVYARTARSGKRVDGLLLALPVVGPILRSRFVAYFLHSTSLLLEGAVPLVESLSIVGDTITNELLKKQIGDIEYAVKSGDALSVAMVENARALFGGDLIAMVRVGEESGKLAFVLHKAASLYHDQVVRQLARVTALLQPALMIMLGGLIALLVLAVYGPIVTMARIV